MVTFKITGDDFNDDIIEKIKAYIRGKRSSVITISIEKGPSAAAQKETREEYFEKLNKSIAELDRGENLVTFTMEEFQNFTKK